MATIHDGTVVIDNTRRADLQKHEHLNGISYLEVVTAPEEDNQLLLLIYFLPNESTNADKLDTLLTALVANPGHVTITGGAAIRNIKVTNVARHGDALSVRVNHWGDFSDYTLTIANRGSLEPLIDPFYAQVEFNFKAGCPSRFDCHQEPYCPPDLTQPPAIDYMAKDYASFRQELINLIPTLVPGWGERREADFAMTLLELLAYTGDQLSYFQDAVANEAYLETARQRISVRRHARLIDYSMHDGLSATTFVHFTVGGSDPVVINNGTGDPSAALIKLFTQRTYENTSLRITPDTLEETLETTEAVFEVLLGEGELLHFHPNLNHIRLWTFGNQQAYLPQGGVSAVLEGDLAWSEEKSERWRLKAGDFLLFEEQLGPEEGVPADADPTHRQVVRLTEVRAMKDKLLGDKELTVVKWGAADALRFPLCIAALTSDQSEPNSEISVARGNLALAFHGNTMDEWHPSACVEGAVGMQPDPRRPYRFLLKEPQLSFLPASAPLQAVSELMAIGPRGAKPAVTQLVERFCNSGEEHAWQVTTPDLLESGRFAREVVVETDNLGRALLRFGDGQFGKQATKDAFMRVTYRTGVGTAGNIGADRLRDFYTHLYRYEEQESVLPGAIENVRNPLPAWGGTDPEPIERVKQQAPAAFHAETYRAVTEQDYAEVAMQHARVRNAVATFRWTGSWHTVFIAVDPVENIPLDESERAELESSVVAWVNRRRIAGYDLEIDAPTYVPVMVELLVCASPGYFPSDVEEALMAAFSNRINPDRSRGFFHPDNFSFGEPLYLSRIYAATAAVAGVASIEVTRFTRRYEPDPDPARPTTRRNIDSGYINVGRLEIIRLDNDPSFPENGMLAIRARGGQ